MLLISLSFLLLFSLLTLFIITNHIIHPGIGGELMCHTGYSPKHGFNPPMLWLSKPQIEIQVFMPIIKELSVFNHWMGNNKNSIL